MNKEHLLKKRIQIVEKDLEWAKILYGDSVISDWSIKMQRNLNIKVKRFERDLEKLRKQLQATQKVKCKKAKQALLKRKKHED